MVDQALIAGFVNELNSVIAEGCQVVPQADGDMIRIGFGQMDRETRATFLDACVDFTDYVNRGLDPEVGNQILEEFLDKAELTSERSHG